MTSNNHLKQLAEANKKKMEASEKLQKKLQNNHSKPNNKKVKSKKINTKKNKKESTEPACINPKSKTSNFPPWGKLHSGGSKHKFFSRTEPDKELQVQPWAHELVNLMLESATEGGINLCLIWPAHLNGPAVLHSLANIERNFAKDLKGMRTLLYPGTHSSRIILQTVLANRSQLSDLFRSLWVTKEKTSEIESHTKSSSYEAMLNALNDIRINNPEVSNPSFSELAPAFTYNTEIQDWITTTNFPLERSLKKVDRLAHRRGIRNKINNEWGDLTHAPGALMVLHRNSKRNDWKKALNSLLIDKEGEPELFLLDATSAADQGSHSSVMNIPNFLSVAIENGYKNTGSLIVTDDPKIFFTLGARLRKLKLNYKSKAWAAEAEEAILSSKAVPAHWEPEPRSNANFQVNIVDRDASQIALSFQHIAQSIGNEDNPHHQAVIKACLYVLRLSNLPAGYCDLTAETSETDGNSFMNQRVAWTPILLGLQGALESGALNAYREKTERAISRAEALIDKWSDATPMAAKLLSEIQKYVLNKHKRLAIVLPNNHYINLAKRFLQRKLEESWSTVESKLDWNTLHTVHKTITDDCIDCHFIFIGINRNVMRILITHPDIPHGTSVLITYKQAESTLITLKSMIRVDSFKPYRGRMGLLAQQIEQRLNEIPNSQAIGKLREMKMTFNFENDEKTNTETTQSCYKFELEDGVHVYSSGWLYRYEPDDDPFFRRTTASSIHKGDYIFEMSSELRIKLESALQLTSSDLNSLIYPQRVLLKLYHDDIKSRCDLFFKATKRSALANEIYAKMLEIDSVAAECRPGRVYYWLDLHTDGDTRPHAPKDAKFFKIFCKALQINDEEALNHWNIIRNARSLSQDLGRELSTRYAEILFQPESALVYRNISEAVIKQLQQESLRCVYRVEKIIPPQNEQTEVLQCLEGEK